MDAEGCDSPASYHAIVELQLSTDVRYDAKYYTPHQANTRSGK